MQLERLAVDLRPRNGWEAVDLGVRLAMRHLRTLYAAWLTVTLPVAFVVLGLLGFAMDHPFWAMFILWWLKPAFDRVALHVMSHVVFGEEPGVRETLHALPRLLLRTGLLRGLTLGRIDTRRSVRLPVEMLEGLRGRTARQRRNLIAQRISGVAVWQTIAWIHLEALLALGLWGLCLLLVPQEILEGIDFEDMFSAAGAGELMGRIAMCVQIVATLLLEPLYVAGGFMLYLKRRSDLEAWDVELQFRRLAEQERERSAGMATFVAMLCACVLCVFVAEPAHADQTSEAARQTMIDKADDGIERVLKRPEFGQERTTKRLQWRRDDNTRKADWSWPDWLKGWLEATARAFTWIGQALATVGRGAGWLLIAGLVLVVLYVVLRQMRGWKRPGSAHVPPAELAGFDIRPESLPRDVAAVALQWLREGRAREALSLLFRGALSALAHRDHVPFARGDTEGDCLDRVRQHASAHFRFLARLLAAWQTLAYAHRSVADAEIAALCEDWPRHFGAQHG